MHRNLVPFSPETTTLVTHEIVPHEDVLGSADPRQEYGFKTTSAQYKFATTSEHARIFVLQERAAPLATTLTDASVVARLIARTRGRRVVLELWYVGAHASHPLNDNDRGKRWGVYGIGYDDRRWYDTHEATRLNPSNFERFVRGSPNPYVTRLLHDTIVATGAKVARQNEALPCAKLFHKDYDHRSHPAISLVYRTLGFVWAMEGYVWDETDVEAPLAFARMGCRMRLGIPVVSEAQPLRRPIDGSMGRVCA